MAKLIFSKTEGNATVKAYWNSDDKEYRVRLWCNGKERKNADAFTPDKDDAIGTAKAMLVHNNCGKSFGGCGCGKRRR
jgi:hypothetical protein